MERLLSRPLLVVLLAFALALPLLPHAGKRAIDNRLEENVLPGEDLERYRRFLADFGNDRVLVAVFGYGTIDAPTIRALHRLERSLLSTGLVDRIISPVSILRDTFDLDDPDSLEVWLESGQRIRNYADRLFRFRSMTGTIVNPATRSGSMLVALSDRVGDTDIEPVDRLIRMIEEAPGLSGRMRVTGIPEIVKTLHAYTTRDNRLFTPATVGLVILMLAWLYRSAAGVLLPLLSVLLPTVWTMGLHNLLGNSTNFITAMVPPLILTNVLTGCIHLLTTVSERCAAAGGFRRAIVVETARDLARPILLCQVTTMIGFLTLAGNGIGAVRTYGIYAGLGVMLGLFTTLLFLPAGLLLVGPRALRSVSFSLPRRVFGGGAEFAGRHRRAILAGSLLLALVSLAGMARLELETSLLRYLPPGHELLRKVADVERNLYGIVPIHLTLEARGDTLETTLLSRKTCLSVARFKEASRKIPDVDVAVSYVDLVQDYDREFSGEPDHIPPSAEEVFEYLAFFMERRPEEEGDMLLPERLDAIRAGTREALLWRFITRDFRRAHVALRTRDVSSRRLTEIFAELARLAKLHLPPEIEARLTGRAVLWADASETLVLNQVENFFWSLLFIAAAIAIPFRSVKVGLLALPPNVLPILAAHGAMGFLGMNLNTVTGMLACVAIGMAVDDTVHYLHALRRKIVEEGVEETRAVREALELKGSSIVFTTVVIAAGFAVLCLSEFRPTFHFGMLVTVTMVGALLLELLLTPALALTFRPFRRPGPPPVREGEEA